MIKVTQKSVAEEIGLRPDVFHNTITKGNGFNKKDSKIASEKSGIPLEVFLYGSQQEIIDALRNRYGYFKSPVEL